MSGREDNKRQFEFVKTCASCSEIMPKYEMVCYCGGAVKVVKLKRDEALKAKGYLLRKFFRRKAE